MCCFHLLIGRSSACQVAEWQHGIPRPHKEMCGRPLTEDMLRPSTRNANANRDEATEDQELPPFPDSDVTFTRSPTLVRQIEVLHKNEDCDYVV